jgi:hypothetical protein
LLHLTSPPLDYRERPNNHKRIKKRNKDRPKRPLSAYNIFFQEERQRILAELPDKPASVVGDSAETNPVGEVAALGNNGDEQVQAESGAVDVAKDAAANNETKDVVVEKENDANEETRGAIEEGAGAEGVDAIPVDDETKAKISAGDAEIAALASGYHKPRAAAKRPHGKIGFESLARTIGSRWKALEPKEVEYYKEKATTDMARYKAESK